jgi:hypothetical protein
MWVGATPLVLVIFTLLYCSRIQDRLVVQRGKGQSSREMCMFRRLGRRIIYNGKTRFLNKTIGAIP